MSEQEKIIIEQYCEKMDARHRRLMTVIYGLIVAIAGAVIIQLVSFGEVKAEGRASFELITFVSKDYTPTWYMEGMTRLFSIHTRQISAIIENKKEEIERLDADFQETIKVLQDNFIRMRGGVTNTTRSKKESGKGGNE